MALTLRGSAENSSGSLIDLTITHPVGIANEDSVYVAYVQGGSTDLNLSIVTAGYTELADLFSNDTTDCNFGVFRKIMGVTPDSDVVCDNVGNSSTIAGVEHVWTGADQTTPEDATTTTATGIDAAAPDSPSIVTATPAAIVLAIGGSSEADATVVAPTGYSNQIDRALGLTVGMASKSVASPGTEDPAVWTNFSGNANDSWCAATVAVRPAATGAAGDGLEWASLPPRPPRPPAFIAAY